ncbi:hypothetical protein BRX37_18215 [Sphingomonas sp. S-NIH.Pt3_0716]|nr:hypothetical protein BRX37_18215 [Sphingomonas sp. S-NIH.Pt3_0716]
MIIFLYIWGVESDYLIIATTLMVIAWACMGAYIAQLRCVNCKSLLYREEAIALSDFKKIKSRQRYSVLDRCPKCGAEQYL